MKLRAFFVFVFFAFIIDSFGFYDYDSNCQKAFQEILNLKTNTAREILRTEKSLNPGHSYVIYLEHYADAVELIVTGDEKRFDKFYNDYYQRREIMDKEDPASPYHKLLQAEMLFHMGLAQLKFGNRFSGASKIYSSYFLIKDNQKEHPDFWMNKKMHGVYNVIFANIPASVRWAARMIGMKGNMETGLSELKIYFDQAKSLPGYAEEGVLFINFAYKYKWDEESGLEFFSGLASDILENTLVRYFYANLASFAGRNELALQLLEKMLKDHYEVPFYGVEYQLGRCKLNRLDPDADLYLLKYLNEAPGLDYKKDICNRLSYYYLVNGDIERYKQYRGTVSKVGSDLRDRDREAMLESNQDYTPHVGLLKARLLFDGGYYDKAEATIAGIPVSELSIKPYRLEYFYRKGRIFQEEKKTTDAIDNLTQSLLLGEDDPYPFATLAAYQLGMIYEKQNDYPKALSYFEKCLDIFDSEYTVESIENQAEKGEERAKRMMEK
jgi:tetratricopeptide (TPR) repeat protein